MPTTSGRLLTHSQQQIWMGQRLAPESPLYNMAFAFVFPPGLDESAFRAAWQRVADSSDALRTRVYEQEGGVAEWRLAEHGPSTDVAAIVPFESVDAFHAWCAARAALPLPLDGDLVDSVLVAFADGRTGWYLNQHHLVADAFSTTLLFREVSAGYEAIQQGTPAPVALSPYYETVSAVPAGPALREAAARHWASRRQIDAPAVTFYGRRAKAQSTRSTRLTLELDERRSAGLDRRSQEAPLASPFAHVSRFALFAMLLGAWRHRISGDASVGFDAPVGGRPTPTARRSLGLFVELFPFAMEIEAGDTFRSLSARCVEETTRLLRHALPGTSLPSRTSASGVVLNYVPDRFGTFAGLPVGVTWIHPGHGDSVHRLRLQVHTFAASQRYTLHFDFNDDALEERLRQRSLVHFEKLLDAFLVNPDSPIGSVDVLADEERRALATLNDTGRAPLPHETVVAMFDRVAGREPDRIALRAGGAEMRFGELRASADAVGAALLAAGVQPGERVAIAGRRSILTVAAILGTLKARAAYVPIDAAAPPARIDYLIDDSRARVLLTSDRASSQHRIDVLAVADILRHGTAGPRVFADPELTDLAYLLYTSGSTGLPKGVPIGHGGLADYLLWAERQYVRGERLTYALCTSLAFDLTVTSLFLPLITGGTLEIYPEPDGPVDTAVADVVAANVADFIKLTPSHLSVVRQLGLRGSRIGRMVIGGEDLKTSLAAAVSADLDGKAEIYNEYGPTEAVVGCTVHRFDPVRDTSASVPIGRPADHVHVTIRNESDTPVPEGVPGELWVSRYGLANGYHARPDLTRERFLADPDRPDRVRYRTGDLVRLADPETLEYLGRLDRQIKIAGHRVEPTEVEVALASLPSIERCAVVVRRRGSGQSAVAPVRRCKRCGLAANVPRISLDGAGLCSLCRTFEAIEPQVRSYFRTRDDLRSLFAASRRIHPKAPYDCLMLYSGGKDSSYALAQLVAMGLSVYAFTLDNGFLSADAKTNIRRVTEHLGVPVEFGTTPGMAAILRDSLERFSNVCNGCFKTIYTLGLLRAQALAIPIVVTGLSRGQLFETRLSPEMFQGDRSASDIDAAVLAARKAYHRSADAVSRALDVRAFDNDRIFEDIQVVDFYRYYDVSLEEMLSYLAKAVPWIRPRDTGRSTNCLINDVGIEVHRRERGYHSYALPYSWDVRLGHKTREAALDELDDDIDVNHVRRMLAEIGYSEARIDAHDAPATLVAYYVTSGDAGEEDVRQQLASRVPAHLVPTRLHRVASIPLTANGKVDEAALLRSPRDETASRPAYTPPDGPVATYLARLWQDALGVDRVGADDSFFALGGTSLVAMQMTAQLCREFAISLPLATVFARPVLADLARAAEDCILDPGN